MPKRNQEKDAVSNTACCGKRGQPRQRRAGVADLNLDEIQEVRNVWQFFRDRCTEKYEDIVNPL